MLPLPRPLTPLYLLRVGLAIGIVGFVCAGVYIGTLLVRQQAAVDPLGRGNVGWLIAQSPPEVARLEQRISAYGSGVADVDAAEVKLRFDIVVNRMRTLRSDFLKAFIASDPRHLQTLATFDSIVEAARPMIDAIDAPGMPARALELLAPLYPKLVRLSVDANSWNAAQLQGERAKLFRLQWIFAWVALGLVLCGLLFIVLLLANNRLLTRTHGQLRRKEEALRTQNQWFEAALDNMSHGLCLTDAEQRLLVCNRQFLHLFGLDTRADWHGTPLSGVLPPAMLPVPAGADAADGGSGGGASAGSRHDSTHRLGDAAVISVSHEQMEGGGWVSTFEDISERQRAQDRIAHLAHHDSLTGLPNRLQFWERTEQAMERLRSTGAPFAILYLDMDRFKEVNDTLGHPTGDELLRAIAHRLKAAAPPPDVVARLGGDEFAILHSPQTDLPSSTAELAGQLLETIKRPYNIDGSEILLTTSVGVAFAPEDGTSSDVVIKKADLALYRAKSLGANTYCHFESEIEESLWRRRSLADDLRQAVEAEQFELHYQPLVSLSTMKIVSGEALLRWNHPVHGRISPEEFIPIAEETGCIEALGEWVLRRAFADAVRWPDDVRVSVNLSSVQFRDATFYERISTALATSGLPAQRAELEITESVLLQDTDANIQTLRQLNALGFNIALDDFGTGYSSLSYLLRFPFSKIKIDQCFVRGLESQQDSLTIIRSIATLAQRLKMTTTAEGVETPEQLSMVLSAGCTEAQGFYFRRPMPEREFHDLLLAENSDRQAVCAAGS